MRKPIRTTLRPAFTLIELLVVIAIIAVLVRSFPRQAAREAAHVPSARTISSKSVGSPELSRSEQRLPQGESLPRPRWARYRQSVSSTPSSEPEHQATTAHPRDPRPPVPPPRGTPPPPRPAVSPATRRAPEPGAPSPIAPRSRIRIRRKATRCGTKSTPA